VHWRTTAKLGRPIVRQYERRRSRDVALLIDPYLPPRPRESDEGLLELAISLAATAAYDITSRGQSRLTIGIAGRNAEIQSGPASDLFCREILCRLADLTSDHDYPIAQSLEQTLEAAPRGVRLLVISPRSFQSAQAAAGELPINPDDFVWLDVGSPQLAGLFVLE
jgi:uncharacterized protein (DUF58 family)